MATKGAYSGPICVSSSARSRAARPGLAPPVPIAIWSAPRRTTAGAMKVHASGTSITFKRTRSRSASSASRRISSGSRVEA